MLPYFFRFLLIIAFFQISIGFAQGGDYNISLRKETITVLGIDSGYVSHVECYGKTAEEGGAASVYFNQIEKVDDIKVGFYKKGGRVKNFRRLNLSDLAISSGFYNDSRLYVFDLPEDKYFKYEYTKSSNTLFYLSYLPFEVYDADTQVFIIRVPSNLQLRYYVTDTSSLLHFEERTQELANVTEYYFKAVCDTDKNRRQKSTTFLKAKPEPTASIRLIITPKDYIGKEEAFFNNWFEELVEPCTTLDSNTISNIVETVGNCNDQDSIIRILFNIVKNKIRYVDIQIGIGSFKPHDVNYIYEKKQGDCKDMSNLLCQSLKYFDIDANLAISATLSHRFPMDFPSLSSGNHMICVVKNEDGNYLFLDATESEGYYLNPSRQIQGTSVFVVGKDKGFYLDVPVVKAKNNKTILRYNLAFSDNSLIGNYSFEFNAISSLMIKTRYNQSSAADFNRYIINYLEIISPRITYLNYNVEIIDDQLVLFGDVEVSKSVCTSVGDDNYLLLNFIPFPHPYTKLEENTTYITYNTLNTELELVIQTDNQILEIRNKDVQFGDEYLSFSLSASSENNMLHVKYNYIYDDVIFDKDFTARFIEFDKRVKGLLGKAIVFK